MKKLLALILTVVLMFSCLTACDLFKKDEEKITCKKHENYAVFTLDYFEGSYSVELPRTGLGEGAIYYQANLEHGRLTVNYKDSGLIGTEQTLAELTADDEMPISGSGGYIEGDKVKIFFGTLSPVKGEIIIAFTEDALKSIPSESYTISYESKNTKDLLIDGYAPTEAKAGDTVILRTYPIMDADLAFYANGEKLTNTHSDADYWEYVFTMPDGNVVITHEITDGFLPDECTDHIDEDRNGKCDICSYDMSEHEHTYQNYQDEIGHGWSYTCGCMTPPNFAQHFDDDGNGKCDNCGYMPSIDSPNVAQIVLDYEQSLKDELARLQAEHPEYNYYYYSVDEVHCTLILDSDASADDIVAKYNMQDLFANADVSALNAIKMVSIIFERNSFTEDMHQAIKQISDDEALVKNLFIDMYRSWTQSYMPRIEYYADDAKELDYTASQAISVFNGKDVILKSKGEYDAYLDELLAAAEYDYEKEILTDAKDLYDEAFFEENALIITRMITRSSCSIRLTIDNLYVSGNKVYVVIKTDVPGSGDDAMRYAHFGFAVDKNSVADVDEVVTLD